MFSRWQEETGTDIEWKKGGYCFPAYRDLEESTLRSLLPVQKSFSLNIDWMDADRIREIVPGINPGGREQIF